ncbi:MAG: GNAT family N-acetyltransferase [Chitinophagales bacterium]|nr:GNAT family N-acetyltransferase [Chitinophagaceae bacterium]MCB9065012.1 GNAT family N-acetyltransferase [Chitinophagales bacterium]
MSITFRSATVDDAFEISNLSKQFGYNTDEQDTKKYLNQLKDVKDSTVLVALHDNMIVGWIQVSDMLRVESGRFCEVVGLVVDEHHRGKGIGKSLIEEAKTWTINRGCNKLIVRTNVKRNNAHRFYSSVGFTEVKEQKVFEMKL